MKKEEAIKIEGGTRELVWLSPELFEMTEAVRGNLGMSRSAFYRYAIIKLLQDLTVLSTKAKQKQEKIVSGGQSDG